jgi:ABC-type glycerol-3-phosphate transport system substrate-binding protein
LVTFATVLLLGLSLTNFGHAAARAPRATITLNVWEPGVSPYMTKLFDAFTQAHPDIKINLLVDGTLGTNDSDGKLRAAVLGRHSPDLIDSAVPGRSFINLLQPLDQYMSTIGVKASDMVPEAWTYGQWIGHQYGIAHSWDPDTLLYYNKDIFKAVGLNPNKAPSTWAELTVDAAKIDKIDNSGKIQRLGFIPWAGWTNNVVEFARIYGAPFPVVKHGGGLTVNVTDPGTLKALSLYASIQNKYGIHDILAAGYGAGVIPGGGGAAAQMADPFAAGRLGMEVTGPWEIGSLARQAPKLHYGVTNIPVPPGGHPYLVHDGWEWMIPRGAPNPAAAAQLIGWLMQPAQLTQWDLGWGATPTTHAVLAEPAFTKDPAYVAILAADKALGQGSWVPGLTEGNQYPEGATFVEIMDLAAEAVVLGTKTPQKAATDAQAALDSAPSASTGQ